MRTLITPNNAGKKPAYLPFDNLDDRREIRCLLARLHPLKRLAFMKWFCKQASLGWDLVPQVRRDTEELAKRAVNDSGADERLTRELYGDLWHVSANYEVSLDVAFRKLVEVAR